MKKEYPILTNAPIQEALLDIRAKLPQNTALNDLVRFHGQIKERFPNKKERVSFQSGFQVVDGKPVTMTPSGGPDGYLFEAPKEKKIVQARLDGFTFNKLKPYENWITFRTEAQNLWNLYRTSANPERIIRIALRYINRIEIPLPIKDFKEYLLTVPEIAPTLPQGLSHYFMRLLIPNEKIRATATVTETMELMNLDKKLAIIFDIDVWMATDYPPDSTTIWDDLEKLRIFKNQIFFESITKKTKEMLNGIRSS
jgi:uncharacterized protein (TIGR04255 family)